MRSPDIPFWSSITAFFGNDLTADSNSAIAASQVVTVADNDGGSTVETVLVVPITTVMVGPDAMATSFLTVDLTPYSSPATPLSTSVAPSDTLTIQSTSSLTGSSEGPAITSTTLSSRGSSVTPAPLFLSGLSSSSATASSTGMLGSSTIQPVAAAATSSDNDQKHAVITGLSGAIAGLVMIGVVVCIVLRLRRKLSNEVVPDSEKGDPSSPVRKWPQVTVTEDTPSSMPQRPLSDGVVTVDEDHHIIRMSTTHWLRPFAHGATSSFRDSLASQRLRVTNPDLSVPATPRESFRLSDESIGSFIRKQRQAIAAILYPHHSRAGSASNPSSRITRDAIVDVVEVLEPVPALNPSIVSHLRRLSNSTMQIVSQKPPEDPFHTPPSRSSQKWKRSREGTPRSGQTNSLPPLRLDKPLPALNRGHWRHSTSSHETLSTVDSMLLREQAVLQDARTVAVVAARNVLALPTTSPTSPTANWLSTPISGHQRSTYSDPFDLDQPSNRNSRDQDKLSTTRGQPYTPRISLYEGT